jgi:hypothetical protein
MARNQGKREQDLLPIDPFLQPQRGVEMKVGELVSAGGASGEERRIGGGRDKKSEAAKRGRKLGGKETQVGRNSKMTAGF